jgi:phosphoenolpyruvate mutase
MKVYISLIADILHAGHIRLINEGSKHGEVIIGLLSEAACSELEQIPFIDYKKRKEVLINITGVSKVIKQNTASYMDNLRKIKPEIVIHGDDWRTNYQKKYRDEVIKFLKTYNGRLIELPYSSDVDALKLKEQSLQNNVSSYSRIQLLSYLIKNKKTLRILEVHNPLSALIAENSKYKSKGKVIEYDGFWSSSLTDSTSKGKPDIEAVDTSERLNSINQIFDVTYKPMIYDGDTGGKVEHFVFTVKSLERIGVSAIIIEDKTGLKKNSLFGNKVKQTQESVQKFCKKIKAGKDAQNGEDFMIIARVESLILNKGLNDAITRSKAYLKAGADGIMIHSKDKDEKDIFEFIREFRNFEPNKLLVVVPTSYNHVRFEKFQDLGVNVVIYANHLLRAAYPNMNKVAKEILKNGRSLESEKNCLSINEILELIPGTK